MLWYAILLIRDEASHLLHKARKQDKGLQLNNRISNIAKHDCVVNLGY